jgi:predicted N-acetyltransferase YhbS
LIIRQENPREFQLIHDLVKVAFQTAKVSNGDEQNFVDKLRASGNYLPQLALVAEENARVIGHIMLTKTYIATGYFKFEALLLAPLSVTLEYRNRGIGSRLVKESLGLATKMGFKAVFVVGDPAYYGRFGFKSSAQCGVTHDPPIPDPYVMVYELTPNSLAGVHGTVNLT